MALVVCHPGHSSSAAQGDCNVSAYIRRDAVEATVLEPVRRLLLAPEAVDLACATIRELVLEERTRVAEADDPKLAAHVAELEALLAGSTTFVDTLRAALEDLRAKQGRGRARRVAQGSGREGRRCAR